MDILWTYYGHTIERTMERDIYGDTMEVLWKYYGGTIERTMDYYGVNYGRTMEIL